MLSQVVRRGPGWYRGDFHAHTTFSDGKDAPERLVERAREAALDFFAVTDHNTIDALAHLAGIPDMAVIPGVEVTLDIGHFNLFGIDRSYDWLEQLKRPGARQSPGWTTTELMQRTANEGLLASINHPLLDPWAWLDGETALAHLHCLEIWNDPSWPDNVRANPRTVEMWSRWLNEGYRITAIGGSDYHRYEPKPGQNKPAERLGRPATCVYAGTLSAAAILDGLHRRKAYVTMGPTLTFHAEHQGSAWTIGDDLGEIRGSVDFQAAVTGCPPGSRVQLIRNGDLLHETVATIDGATLAAGDRVDPDEMRWYRLDVRDPANQILAVSNPIYAGRRHVPARLRYGDFTG